MALLLVVTAFTACSSNVNKEESQKFTIVATTFPQYDWVRQIIGEEGENIELKLLVDSGIDLHSFQPSVEDIATIANCDIFIYTGGESELWVDDAIKVAGNDDRVVINLIEVLGNEVKDEEYIEGMQHEHADHEGEEVHDEHSHDHDEHEHNEEDVHEEDEHEDHEPETDEHVWLSLKNAQKLTAHISEKLGELDSQNASTYLANADEYIELIGELDKKYENMVSSAKTNVILFGDRFPFRYLFDDYGIDYYAAFPGCSAETEASFETIVFLANKVDELSLKDVFALESSDQSIAKTIISNTKTKDQNILVLDSIQSVGEKEISDGISYLQIMESNYDVIKSSLQ